MFKLIWRKYATKCTRLRYFEVFAKNAGMQKKLRILKKFSKSSFEKSPFKLLPFVSHRPSMFTYSFSLFFLKDILHESASFAVRRKDRSKSSCHAFNCLRLIALEALTFSCPLSDRIDIK